MTLAELALDDIRREESQAELPTRWELAPLSALVDHIVTHYHRRLRAWLVYLVQMAHRVEGRHRERVVCPAGLAAFLVQFQRDVLDHLEKEETIVFPAIVRGSGARLSSPIYALELEHQHHGSDLQRLHALTDELTPPADACATWRALYAGLAELERELMEHVHLENNILFRRALAA